MQCPSCHTENAAGSRFCQNCGATLQPEAAAGSTFTGAAQPGPAYAGTPSSGAYGQAPVLHGGLADNVAGAIAYVTVIPAIIFLLVEPYRSRKFVRFHSVQSIGLFIAWIVLDMIIGFLPFHTWSLYSIISLVLTIAWLICIVSAAQGKFFKLPVIGNIAEQQSRSGS